MTRLVSIISVCILSGCLSVMRIPFPSHEMYSDDGVCTNREWKCIYEEQPELRIYPTIKMRCWATAGLWRDIGPELKGEQLYNARMFKRWGWIPLTVMWLTSPVDAVVDTLYLPVDWCEYKPKCEDSKE